MSVEATQKVQAVMGHLPLEGTRVSESRSGTTGPELNGFKLCPNTVIT